MRAATCDRCAGDGSFKTSKGEIETCGVCGGTGHLGDDDLVRKNPADVAPKRKSAAYPAAVIDLADTLSLKAVYADKSTKRLKLAAELHEEGWTSRDILKAWAQTLPEGGRRGSAKAFREMLENRERRPERLQKAQAREDISALGHHFELEIDAQVTQEAKWLADSMGCNWVDVKTRLLANRYKELIGFSSVKPGKGYNSAGPWTWEDIPSRFRLVIEACAGEAISPASLDAEANKRLKALKKQRIPCTLDLCRETVFKHALRETKINPLPPETPEVF